jgi:hypothetical protein
VTSAIKGQLYFIKGCSKPWKRLVHPWHEGVQVYFVSSKNGKDWGNAIQSKPKAWWDDRAEIVP